MAKDTQLELIDIDSPEFKKLKKIIKDYEGLKVRKKDKIKELNEAEKSARGHVLEAVIAAGVKPDADGAYHVSLDGKVYDLCQDSQLKIKKHDAPKDESPSGADEEAPDVDDVD
jgi:hypothetical protein